MKKSINFVPNSKTFIKKITQDKKVKINPNYFSIKLVPYNIILSNLLLHLRLKLSPSLFNEIYKYLTNEIKKFIKKNISSNNITNNISFNKKQANLFNKSNNKRMISDFCTSNYENDKKIYLFKTKTKVNLKKHIQPLMNLSYSQKLRNELINNKEISSFSNITNKNISNNISLLDDKELSYFLSDNNYINSAINKNSKIKKINTTNTTSVQSKNKIGKIFLSNNYNFNTINTTIHKSGKNKKLTMNKIKKISNINKKIEQNSMLGTVPNHRNKENLKFEKKNLNEIKSRDDSNLKNPKNLNNAVVINNTFFNKYKNNFNFGIIPKDPKKIKVLNIKIKDNEKNGEMRILKPIQNSEEMLDKIKNSLDDDSLKVMLNFSYENFLSKESERESKEYSIED